jgi:hypothetical protein
MSGARGPVKLFAPSNPCASFCSCKDFAGWSEPPPRSRSCSPWDRHRAPPRARSAPPSPLVSETFAPFRRGRQRLPDSHGHGLGFDFETPVSEVAFIKVPAGYGADMRVTVVFRSEKGRQEGGDFWDHRIVVATFGETREPSHRIRFHRDFKLAPGEYRVDVTFEDLNGGRISKALGRVRVPEFGPGALGLGDLQFGFCTSDSVFTLMPSRKFEANLEQFCVKGSVLRPPQRDHADDVPAAVEDPG